MPDTIHVAQGPIVAYYGDVYAGEGDPARMVDLTAGRHHEQVRYQAADHVRFASLHGAVAPASVLTLAPGGTVELALYDLSPAQIAALLPGATLYPNPEQGTPTVGFGAGHQYTGTRTLVLIPKAQAYLKERAPNAWWFPAVTLLNPGDLPVGGRLSAGANNPTYTARFQVARSTDAALPPPCQTVFTGPPPDGTGWVLDPVTAPSAAGLFITQSDSFTIS